MISDGTVTIVNDAITETKILNSAVTTNKINDDAVIASKIADNAVGNTEIATDAVDSDEIAANAVGSSEITTDAVNTDEIATDAVTSSEIAANAVGNSEMNDNAIGSDEIINNSIDVLDMKKPAVNQVLTSDGSSNVVWVDKTDLTSSIIIDDARVLIGNSSNAGEARVISGDISLINTGVTTIVNDAVTEVKILNSAVTENKIAANAVTSTKIATDAVTSNEIATNAVTSNEIATDAVDSDEIAANAVGSSEIATDAVTASEIANNAVGTAEIQTDAVTTNEILNGTIVIADIASPGSDKVLTTDNSNNVTWANKSDLTSSISVADTKILIGDPGSNAQAYALSGHVTMNNTGLVTIADNSINTDRLQNDAVTTVKILNDAVTTDKIVNDAVTSSKIVADAVGSSEIATNAVNTDEIAANAVTSTEIANDAVITSKIIDDAVTTDKIINNAVTTDKILSGAVTTGKIADDAVTTDKIINEAVTTGKIADGDVTGIKIAGDAVTSTKILDGTIISSDIANDAIVSTKILDGTITTVDISDNAVISSKILNGTIMPVDINSGGNSKMLTTNTSGVVEWVDKTEHLYNAGSGISIAPVTNVITNDRTLSIVGTTITLSNGGGSVVVPTGADNLGDHITTQNINLGTNYITDDGTNRGIKINNGGDAQITNNLKLPATSSTIGKLMFVDNSSTGEFKMYPDKSNIGIGKLTLTTMHDPLSTGTNNVAIGNKALENITTASNCIAIGNEALQNNVSGTSSFALGANALKNATGNDNIAIGTGAGLTLTSGTQNTFIGNYADVTSALFTNATAVGYNAKVNRSNKITLGNTAVDLVQFGGYLGVAGTMVMDANGNITTKTESDADNNTTYGNGATILTGINNSMALGNGATVSASNKIVLGNGTVNTVQFAGYQHTGVMTTDVQGNITSSNSISLSDITCSSTIEANSFIATLVGAGAYKYNTVQDMAVPDYVFEAYYNGKSKINPTYSIIGLEATEKFMKANHHLPRVPSRDEILEDGVINIQGIQMVTLEKVEELFIYTIEQEKKLSEQETQIQELRKEMELIKKLINK